MGPRFPVVWIYAEQSISARREYLKMADGGAAVWYVPGMEVRPMTMGDWEGLREIDGTIESSEYVHVTRAGDGLERSWALEVRRRREKLIHANALAEERAFEVRQVVQGIEEGIALLAEHEGAAVGLGVAAVRAERSILEVIDVRVDYDYRRQGLGLGLVYPLIQAAREKRLRAVMAEARADNLPANQFFAKCGFELGGMDTHRYSNHDLVKEKVTLSWYAALD